MRRRLKPSHVAILVVLIGSWAESLMAQTPPSGPPPGVLVAIGDHELHIRCVGPEEAAPTVVLEAGGGDYSKSWSFVQDLLSSRVRTCAYDRAGLGWSMPGPGPRTMRQEVFELHALLEAANLSGPLVLVGHSIGGLLVRLYTEQHDSDVIGVVLVDPTHENSRQGRIRPGERPRLVRVREEATGRVVPEPRRVGRASSQYSLEDYYYVAEEFQSMHLSRRANPESFGNRPLIVLAGTRPGPGPPGVSDDEWNVLKQEQNEEKADLTRLSRNSKLVRDPSSGHNVHVDNPRLVARAIEEVIVAVSTGARLSP